MIVALAIALASGQAATVAEAAPAKEKKVCRLVQNTGSIMGTRLCHSKSEWAAIDKRNGDDAHNLRDLNDRNTRAGAMTSF